MQVGRAYVTIDPGLPFRHHSPPGHRRVAVMVKGSLQVPTTGDSLLSQKINILTFFYFDTTQKKGFDLSCEGKKEPRPR